MKDKDDDFVSVAIPRELFNRVSEKIGDANVQTISKYITYILERELSPEKKQVFTKEDKEKIKERLHRLGYF